jgi:hypothetical protein
VILGMNWMKRCRTLLDTATWIVHLDSLEHGSIALQLAMPPMATTSVQNLEDIPVVYEFPDDLFGMSPDREVEFTIELQPDTTFISRWPYKMTPKELEELKV